MSLSWYIKRLGLLAFSKSHPLMYVYQGNDFADWTDAQKQLIPNGEIVFKNLGADIFAATVDNVPKEGQIREIKIVARDGTSKTMISGVHYDFIAGNVVTSNKIRFRSTYAPASDDYVVLAF